MKGVVWVDKKIIVKFKDPNLVGDRTGGRRARRSSAPFSSLPRSSRRPVHCPFPASDHEHVSRSYTPTIPIHNSNRNSKLSECIAIQLSL